MRIAGDHHRAWNDVALFDHHLMGNAGSRWVEIDAVLARERLDLCVLRQIFGRSILDVVIDGEDWLCRIGNRCRTDLLKFRNHGAGVVMRHHMARANRNEIAAVHRCPRSESIRVTRRNLFNECKSHITLGLPATHTNHAKTGLYPSRKCHSGPAIAGEEALIIFRSWFFANERDRDV